MSAKEITIPYSKIFVLTIAFIIFLGISHPAICADLTWSESSGEVDGYRIYYGTSSESLTDFVESWDTSYPLDFLPIIGGETYYIAVTAYNSAGESSFSNMCRLSVDPHTGVYSSQCPGGNKNMSAILNLLLAE